jgi:hypothetical protein
MRVATFLTLPSVVVWIACVFNIRRTSKLKCLGDACLITQTPYDDLVNPVYASDGRIYDAHALQGWLSRCAASNNVLQVLPCMSIDNVILLPPKSNVSCGIVKLIGFFITMFEAVKKLLPRLSAQQKRRLLCFLTIGQHHLNRLNWRKVRTLHDPTPEDCISRAQGGERGAVQHPPIANRNGFAHCPCSRFVAFGNSISRNLFSPLHPHSVSDSSQ